MTGLTTEGHCTAAFNDRLSAETVPFLNKSSET